jgi:hypothetical protein
MENHVRKIFFSLAVLAVISLPGCDQADVAPAAEPAVQKQVANQAVHAASQSGKTLQVGIAPDPPTADGCLKVLVGGTTRANYLWEVNGVQLTDQTANTLCEGFTSGDEVMVTVNANQVSGSARVTIANAPPRITEVTVNAEGISRHTDLVIGQEVVDADNDYVELRYQWYVNEEADPLLTENILPANRYRRGDTIRFTITPSDGIADGAVYQSASVTVPNAAPQVVSALPEHFETLEYSYQCKAIDPDGDDIAYSLEGAPAGMTINSATGLVVWPLSGVKGGDYPVKIVASDPSGAAASQEFILTIGTVQN